MNRVKIIIKNILKKLELMINKAYDRDFYGHL